MATWRRKENERDGMAAIVSYGMVLHKGFALIIVTLYHTKPLR